MTLFTLFITCLTLSLPSGLRQMHATPPETESGTGDEPTPTAQWKDLNPLLVGSAHPILVNDAIPHLSPIRTVSIPEGCDEVRSVGWSAGHHDLFLLFGFDEGGSHLWLVDGVSGTIKRTLHTAEGEWVMNETLIALPGKDGFLFQPGLGMPIMHITFDEALEQRQFGGLGPEERVGSFVFGGGIVAAMSDRTTIRRWQLATGAELETCLVKNLGEGTFLWPLALDDQGRMLAAVGEEGRSSSISIAIVNLDTCELKGRVNPASALVTASESGKHFLSARLANEWEGFELWNGTTLERTATRDMSPQISSIGTRLSSDGRFLLLHEYMVQPVIVYDTATGEPVSVIGPQLGGIATFSLSSNDQTMVATVGPWVEGTLRPDRIALYDLTALWKEPTVESKAAEE